MELIARKRVSEKKRKAAVNKEVGKGTWKNKDNEIDKEFEAKAAELKDRLVHKEMRSFAHYGESLRLCRGSSYGVLADFPYSAVPDCHICGARIDVISLLGVACTYVKS